MPAANWFIILGAVSLLTEGGKGELKQMLEDIGLCVTESEDFIYQKQKSEIKYLWYLYLQVMNKNSDINWPLFFTSTLHDLAEWRHLTQLIIGGPQISHKYIFGDIYVMTII